MAGICCWLDARYIKRPSDGVHNEDFRCSVILPGNEEITMDEFKNFCIKCYEECSRYQKMKKLEKMCDKVENIVNSFRRK